MSRLHWLLWTVCLLHSRGTVDCHCWNAALAALEGSLCAAEPNQSPAQHAVSASALSDEEGQDLLPSTTASAGSRASARTVPSDTVETFDDLDNEPVSGSEDASAHWPYTADNNSSDVATPGKHGAAAATSKSDPWGQHTSFDDKEEESATEEAASPAKIDAGDG